MDKRTGAQRIADERQRHTKRLGWTPEHDDEHTDGSLALTAACYAASAAGERVYVRREFAAGESFVDPWPESWDERYDARPYDGNVLQEATRAQAIRLLEKAGALCAAEIDRLLRAAKGGTGGAEFRTVPCPSDCPDHPKPPSRGNGEETPTP